LHDGFDGCVGGDDGRWGFVLGVADCDGVMKVSFRGVEPSFVCWWSSQVGIFSSGLCDLALEGFGEVLCVCSACLRCMGSGVLEDRSRSWRNWISRGVRGGVCGEWLCSFASASGI